MIDGRVTCKARLLSKFSHSLFVDPKNQRFFSLFSRLQHLLPLPGFLLLYNNIWEHMVIASNTESIHLLIGDVPIAWVYLVANCLTQYLCISSVFVLTSECSSLTVTLVVTLRKFVSLLFSIVYFNNPFTVYHWIGTFMVFFGTLIFTEMIPLFNNIDKTTKTKRN